MQYKQGDLVLVPFPFTDLSTNKKRPVIIFSTKSLNSRNYIVVKVTSFIHNDQFSFSILPQDISIPPPSPSEVRINELMTLNESLIEKKFSELTQIALERLLIKVKANFEIE